MDEIRQPLTGSPARARSPRSVAALFVVALFAVPSDVRAQCPAPGPIPQEYQRATLVFVADVISIRPAPQRTAHPLNLIRFKVVERLKGAIMDDAELAFNSGSEEYYFKVGQRFLVYLRRWGDAWSAGCTRTKEFSLSDSEVATVRALRDRQRDDALRGAAQSGSIAGLVSDAGGAVLPGVAVTTIPESGGTAQFALTAGDGSYQIDALPEGTYRVDFQLLGFDVSRRNHVRVTAGTTAGADGRLRVTPVCECVESVPRQPVGDRAGQVLDESGRPLPHARLRIGGPFSESAYSDGDGHFNVRLPLHQSTPLTASDSGFLPQTQQVSGDGGPIVFRLMRESGVDVPDSQQFDRGCSCEGIFRRD